MWISVIRYRKKSKGDKKMKWKVWDYKDDTPLLIIEADSSDAAIKKAREINYHYTATQRIKEKGE